MRGLIEEMYTYVVQEKGRSSIRLSGVGTKIYDQLRERTCFAEYEEILRQYEEWKISVSGNDDNGLGGAIHPNRNKGVNSYNILD